MKAILYRKPSSIYTGNQANHDWNIQILDLETQDQTRGTIEYYLKGGYEVQLIDYKIHNDHTYSLTNILNDHLLGTVESFYNPNNGKIYDTESSEEDVYRVLNNIFGFNSR